MVVAFAQRAALTGRRPQNGIARTRRMRLFIALWPDADTRVALSMAGMRFAAAGRNVPPPNLHMTLAFLGASAVDAVPRLLRVMREARPMPCDLHLDQFGYFASGKILWLGSSHPVPALVHYQQRLSIGLREAGFSTEQRSFKPHVTLVRDCVRPNLAGQEPVSVDWCGREFALVESIGVPGGVRYRVLESLTA
jgi:2'-5' RNA ligase